MKKLMALSALLSVLVITLFTGCATTAPGQRDLAPAIKTAAYVGSAYALREHPEWREGFEVATRELAVLETSERIDFATILSIVNRLPVDELKSRDAALIITGATILLSEYGGHVDLETVDKLRPLARALREGIALGLH